ITPARSLNKPPNAAKSSGVETRKVEARSCRSMTNGSISYSCWHGAEILIELFSARWTQPTPKAFGRDRQNDQRLKNQRQLTSDVFGFQIQVRSAFVQRAKEQRRYDNSEGAIASQ